MRGLWENVNDEIKHAVVTDPGEVRIVGIDDIKGDLAREVYLLIFAQRYVVDHLDPVPVFASTLGHLAHERDILDHAHPEASDCFDEDAILHPLQGPQTQIDSTGKRRERDVKCWSDGHGRAGSVVRNQLGWQCPRIVCVIGWR